MEAVSASWIFNEARRQNRNNRELSGQTVPKLNPRSQAKDCNLDTGPTSDARHGGGGAWRACLAKQKHDGVSTWDPAAAPEKFHACTASEMAEYKKLGKGMTDAHKVSGSAGAKFGSGQQQATTVQAMADSLAVQQRLQALRGGLNCDDARSSGNSKKTTTNREMPCTCS